MLVSAVLALQQEVLVVKDDFTVYILHKDPEGLGKRRQRERRGDGIGEECKHTQHGNGAGHSDWWL